MKKNTALLFFASLLFHLILPAQKPIQIPAPVPGFVCSAEAAMQSVPWFQQLQQQLEDHLLSLPANLNASKAGLPYTLPVVVHVVHQNGVENISDQRVFDAIGHLNDAFAHVGYYAQQGPGANTQIQFCLAQRTPDGEPTNGIMRVESPLTEMDIQSDDVSLKNQSRWNPLEYVNIWVVKSITSQSSGPGVAGYAYLAAAHGAPYDGIVCEAAFFGAGEQQDAVLIHEMGHYLNLYHTFQGGCPNGDCQVNGDRVCDTPPDKESFSNCNSNSCSTDADDSSPNNPLTSDVNDATENFMDYSPFSCYHAFTEGQGVRMQAAIEFFRSSLLDSKGCQEPCATPLSASFSYSPAEVFAGETVALTNLSTGATSYEWSLNGSLFSTSFEPPLTFDSAGIFLLTLAVTNEDSNCYEIHLTNITVQCNVEASFTVNALELQAGEPFVCQNTSTGANDYEWLINGVTVGTGTNLNYTFGNSGAYAVILHAAGDFCTKTSSVTVYVSAEECFVNVLGGYLQLTNAISTDFLLYGDMTEEGNVYVETYLPPDAGMVSRIDANETVLWHKKIESNQDGIRRILTTEDGGAFVHFQASNSPDQTFFATDTGGVTKWTKKAYFNNEEFEILAFEDGIAMFDDNYINKKFTTVGLNHQGDILWNKIYTLDKGFSVHSAQKTSDGEGFWIAGNGGDLTNFSAVVMKMDLSGNVLFVKRYANGPGGYLINTIDSSPDGGFIATGLYNGVGTDFFIMKGDGEGNLEWAKIINDDNGVSSEEYGLHSISIPGGSGYMAFLQKLDGGINKWLSFTNNGELVFARSYKRDNGSTIYMRLRKWNEKLFASWLNSNSKNIYIEYEPDIGPKMDCVESVDYDLTPVDAELFSTDISFSLSSATTLFQNSSLVELPVEHEIIPLPYCSFETPCPELCGNSLDDDDDGFTDCFDPDCHCFAAPECQTEDSPTVEARLAWQSNDGLVSAVASPMVANLNPQGDNFPEIIVPEGYSFIGDYPSNLLIFRDDGSNASWPDTLSVPGGINFATPTPAIADIDSDGVPELIIVSLDNLIRVFTGYSPGSQPPMQLMLSSTDLTATDIFSPQLADFNQDGVPEIILGNEIFQFDLNANPTMLAKALAGNGHAGQYSPSSDAIPMAFDLLSVSDCGSDPDCEGLELAAGAYVYSIDLDPFDGDGLEMKVQRNLHDLFVGPSFGDGHTFIADVDMDWTPNIVTAGSVNGNPGIYVWDKNGYNYFFPYPASPNGIEKQFATATVANVFDDTEAGFFRDWPEIVAASSGWVTAFSFQALSSSNYSDHWWSVPTDDIGYAGTSCFDLNGDGLAEIFLRDQSQFRILYGSAEPFPEGVDDERNWFTLDCYSETYHEYPVVADLDADGQAEIAFTGRTETAPVVDTRGRLWVVESAGNAWAPARPIWNQYQYFGLNVNDDLSIPRQQQRHDLEFPELFSYHRPFNISLSQMPAVDENFEPYLPVPDATVDIGEVHCENDSLFGVVQVCNIGSTALPDSMPLAFYQGDPRQAGAQPMSWFPIGETVEAGECAMVSFAIASTFNTPIFVVVNDDLSGPLPYNPASDFPVTRFLECGYENNFASFSFPFQPVQLDLGPDRNQCENIVFTLYASGSFAAYRWQDGSSDSTFTVFEPGTYWVDVWDACGGHQSDTVQVGLAPPFDIIVDTVLNASSAAAADGAILVETVQGGVPPFTYQWSNGPTTISNPGILPGNYTVTVTGADGCEKTYSFTVDAMVGTGRAEAEHWEVQLVPNPASNSGQAALVIQSNSFQKLDYLLIDVAGRQVAGGRLQVNPGASNWPFSVPGTPGLYFVQLVNAHGRSIFLKWVVF